MKNVCLATVVLLVASAANAAAFPEFPYAPETYVRANVLQLVEYLSRIQQE